MRPAGVVFRKELVDAVRDRRSLFAALIYPLFAPLLVVGMFAWLSQTQSEDRPVRTVLLGADHAPGLVAYLRDEGLSPVPAPADPQAALAEGEIDAVLEIPPDYGANLRAFRPAVVRVVVDGSRARNLRGAARIQEAVARYGATVGGLRLLIRGVDPRVAHPVAVEVVDVATERGRAAMILGFLPMFVVLAGFVGGMYVATDTTAGERERGSLEPLLLHPVPRGSLLLGKWAAAVTFALASVVLTVTALWVALSLAPLDGLGVERNVGGAVLARMAAVALPVAPFGAALQILVATFARTFREAQTHLSLLMLVPMLVGMVAAFDPVVPRPWMALIPVYAQEVALVAIFRGDGIPTGFLAASIASSGLVAAVALAAAARSLRSERVVFGR